MGLEATLIPGSGLFTPDLTADALLAILAADVALTGNPVMGSFSTASTGCNASVAKGSALPLLTVFAQFSPLVAGIKPALLTETGLPGTMGEPAATTGVGTIGVAAAGAGVVGTAAVGAVAGVTLVLGDGVAAGLLPSPQLVKTIAIPIAPK